VGQLLDERVATNAKRWQYYQLRSATQSIAQDQVVSRLMKLGAPEVLFAFYEEHP